MGVLLTTTVIVLTNRSTSTDAPQIDVDSISSRCFLYNPSPVRLEPIVCPPICEVAYVNGPKGCSWHGVKVKENVHIQ